MIESKTLSKEILKELDSVVDKIKNKISVNKIILFGSYAEGSPRIDSDIDLCVITDDKRRKIEIIWDIQESIYKTAKHTVDILVYKPDEFLYRADSVATIEKTISNKGVVIYG
jgi:predicted nucleotidyltransferase